MSGNNKWAWGITIAAMLPIMLVAAVIATADQAVSRINGRRQP